MDRWNCTPKALLRLIRTYSLTILVHLSNNFTFLILTKDRLFKTVGIQNIHISFHIQYGIYATLFSFLSIIEFEQEKQKREVETLGSHATVRKAKLYQTERQYQRCKKILTKCRIV